MQGDGIHDILQPFAATEHQPCQPQKQISPPEIQGDDIFFANIIIGKSSCWALQVIYSLCALKMQQLSQGLEEHLSSYLPICLVRSFSGISLLLNIFPFPGKGKRSEESMTEQGSQKANLT